MPRGEVFEVTSVLLRTACERAHARKDVFHFVRDAWTCELAAIIPPSFASSRNLINWLDEVVKAKKVEG